MCFDSIWITEFKNDRLDLQLDYDQVIAAFNTPTVLLHYPLTLLTLCTVIEPPQASLFHGIQFRFKDEYQVKISASSS